MRHRLVSCVAESEDIVESQRIAKLGCEGKARIEAREAMKQQAMSYALKLDLKEDVGEFFEGRSSDMTATSSDGGSDTKFVSLKAEGEARIAKREAMAEAKKIYDLTQVQQKLTNAFDPFKIRF